MPQLRLGAARRPLPEQLGGDQAGPPQSGEHEQGGQRPGQVAKGLVPDENCSENPAEQRGLAHHGNGREQASRHGERQVDEEPAIPPQQPYLLPLRRGGRLGGGLCRIRGASPPSFPRTAGGGLTRAGFAPAP